MIAASEFRERLGKIKAKSKAEVDGPARFTVWFMKREVGRMTDEELEVLLAQFRVEVSE